MYRKTAFFFVRTNEAVSCPLCGEVLTHRSWRRRRLTDAEDNTVTLMLRRMNCTKCQRIHHELPDCVVPYKRHCTETIEAVINGDVKQTPCNVRTIKRLLLWWKTVASYFLNILKSLAVKYGTPPPVAPSLASVVRAVVNSNNWICAKTLCTRSAYESG